MTAIQMALLGGAPSASTIWDLKVASTPAGLNYYPSQSSLQTAFSATDGYQTAGDASGSVYELQTDSAYAGDYLFQASVLIANNCSDPSIAIFTSPAATPTWQWGAGGNRISIQCDCTTPVLYGNVSGSTSSSGSIPYGASYYATLHLSHEPSLSRTRAWLTSGLNDWTSTGTQIGSTMSIADNYGATPVYCGLASDYDGASVGSASTNFQVLRVTKL